MAKAVQDKFHKPCVAIGNIRDPQVAEDIIANGTADLIGLGRGLIADPDWCNKAKYGDVNTIRKCISCNIGCVGNRIGGNRPLRCTVNPDIINGDEYKKNQVWEPCNVVVIGAGTAGLEAACTAAEVGCNVTLIEKKDVLGGLATEISKIPDKKRLGDLPKYLIYRAEHLHNLKIMTGTEPTADFVKSLNPDLIVNSTGSVALLPPIKGLHDCLNSEEADVYTVFDVIENVENGTYPESFEGKKVIVIGGGAVGLDVVEYFAPKGADVSIIEMMPIIGNGLDASSKASTGACMEKYNVQQLTNTALQEVRPHSFVVKTPQGEIVEMPFDYGFICLGMRANAPVLAEMTALADSLPHTELINIGDSVRARRIIDGTWAGRHQVLATLERMGFMD